jgi:hypothetical protein
MPDSADQDENEVMGRPPDRLNWTVGMSAVNLMLEVRSAGTGIATLHGMFC